MPIPFKPVLAAAAIAQAFPAFAADPAPQSAQTLNEITVTGTHKTQKLGEEKIRRKTLDKLLTNDEHDLVRYDPGISVVEGGRAGSNGFTIRGVDKDRVAINLTGWRRRKAALPKPSKNCSARTATSTPTATLPSRKTFPK